MDELTRRPRGKIDPLVAELRRRRVALGLSQSDLGALLHITQATYCELESGRYAPTIWNLRRVAEVLDCDVVLVPRSTVRRHRGKRVA